MFNNLSFFSPSVRHFEIKGSGLFGEKKEGAFHSTKKSGLNFRMFAVCRMERYFPHGRTDLVERILPDKMLKDHGKLAALSAVSCFMERILTRAHNQFKQIVPRY